MIKEWRDIIILLELNPDSSSKAASFWNLRVEPPAGVMNSRSISPHILFNK
jgi:hypothetical protein